MDDSQTPYHDGERAVQRRAGVFEAADEVGAIVGNTISLGAARFLSGQRMAVAASLDPLGQPWASLLTGATGFLQAVDERLLRIESWPGTSDPLATNLAARPELALLVLDPSTRRRMRLNGRGLWRADGLYLLPDQVYGNCPKYIQKRRISDEIAAPPGATERSPRLDDRQQASIARADTFFIASFHARGGADASHRGGHPGFVTVTDPRRLSFPDYPRNNMFNTLGNLESHPQVGLLFVDFESGDLLQAAGTARLVWEPERRVEVEVSDVRETRGGCPLRWELLEYSPSNPLLSVTRGQPRHLKDVSGRSAKGGRR